MQLIELARDGAADEDLIILRIGDVCLAQLSAPAIDRRRRAQRRTRRLRNTQAGLRGESDSILRIPDDVVAAVAINSAEALRELRWEDGPAPRSPRGGPWGGGPPRPRPRGGPSGGGPSRGGPSGGGPSNCRPSGGPFGGPFGGPSGPSGGGRLGSNCGSNGGPSSKPPCGRGGGGRPPRRDAMTCAAASISVSTCLKRSVAVP